MRKLNEKKELTKNWMQFISNFTITTSTTITHRHGQQLAGQQKKV